MWSRTVSPRVSKSHLRRVSSSCPSEGAWDKGAVRRNPIMQGVEASGHETVRKHWATEGELASSRESLLADRGNASWNLINKVWKRAVMNPYASIGFCRLSCPFIFDAFQIFFRRVWQSARLFDYEGFCFRQ